MHRTAHPRVFAAAPQGMRQSAHSLFVSINRITAATGSTWTAMRSSVEHVPSVDSSCSCKSTREEATGPSCSTVLRPPGTVARSFSFLPSLSGGPAWWTQRNDQGRDAAELTACVGLEPGNGGMEACPKLRNCD